MTNQHPQEIELKLTLPPGAVDAFLRRMARRRAAPSVQTLVTLYFDTPDFALSAAGVALRVRRVGRRWLQTLKTEGERAGGLSRRIEYEMPVRGGALDWTRFPPEALAHVPDSARAQVVPVFETRFHRTAWLLKGRGGAQIEVALDVGEVVAGERSQPLCEIELELKSGQPDALFALALDWAGAFGCLPFDVSKAERGVRLAHGVAAAPMKSAPASLSHGQNVEDGFAAIVQACLAQFQANLPGVLESLPLTGEGASAEPTPGPHPNPLPGGEGANAGPTPVNEYVHQARVALRRLRAALRLFRGACVLPDELTAGLRALAAALGPARDWDVLVGETLPAIAPHCPDADAWQRGLAAIEARRGEVRAAMRVALDAAQPGVWLLGMQRWLQRRGWRADAAPALRLAQLAPLDDWARRALKRGHRRVARDARAFDTLPPAARHALRIAIKRQRYAVEFFQPLFAGKRQVRYLAVLRDAQDSLGCANDARVAWGLLASLGTAAGPMGDFARGWLAAKQADADDAESARLMQGFLDTPPCW
ncbi:MAG: CHAD domain-containing protein [Gammaproteobacteria bacterium]